MPETKNGFKLDDTTLLTAEQWAEVGQLIAAGKEDEARQYIVDIRKGFEKKETANKK